MTALMVLLDASAKSVLLIAVAFASMVPLRRSSASVRHLVWCLTLAGVVVLPVMSVVLPRLDVPVLPSRSIAGDDASSALGRSRAVSSPLSVARVETVVRQRSSVAPSPRPGWGPPPYPIFGARGGEAIVGSGAMRSGISVSREETESFLMNALSRVRLANLLLVLWAIGCALLLARLALGKLAVARLGRSAGRVDDADWLQLVEHLATSVGVRRSVLLLRSTHECVPMTWGVARPVILLPASSAHWTQQRRAVVLLHELAHVSRGDAATQLIGQLAQATQWFNPFVWVAARKLREEREHACDDRVIAIGARPVEYADHLLHLVASFGRYEGPVAALAMARRSQFEGRVIAILNPKARRGTVGRVAAALAIAIALCSVPALAALRATSRATQILGDVKLVGARSEPSRAQLQQPVVRAAPRTAERSHVHEPADIRPATKTVAPQKPDSTRSLLEQLVRATPSDGDRARLVMEASRIYARTPAKLMDVVNAASLIEASGDRRTALSALMATAALLPLQRAQMLRVSADMTSAGDKADVLIEYLSRYPLDGFAREPFFTSAASISSSGDVQRVLASAIAHAQPDDQTTSAILQTARRIPSSGDKANILLLLGTHGNVTGPRLHREFIDVAQTIASSSDRERALAVLLGDGAGRATVTRSSEIDTVVTSTSGTTTEVNVSNTSPNNARTTVSIQARNYYKTPDGRGIAKLARGGAVTIQEIAHGEHRMLMIAGNDNQLTYTFRVNGIDRAFDTSARAWLATIIKQYL